ncbi:MAG: aminoglycoside adenylyltransferase domain-containing protein [Psychrobacillus sp.]
MKYLLPYSLHNLMQLYLQQLNTHLPMNLIEGVYLYGSVALDAFDERKSDIDFIVLLNRQVNEKEIEMIKDLHTQLSKEELGSRMDGMYIQATDLSKGDETMQPYPFCADGVVRVGHWDINHVTWWVLKEHGITLQGTDIQELKISTEWEDVLGTLKYNINQYWYEKTKEIPDSVTDEVVEFVTATICRILYSLEYQQIISKKEALRKGLSMLPNVWHPLIKEGMRIRTLEQSPSLFATESSRAEACRDLILYAHELCNARYFQEV